MDFNPFHRKISQNPLEDAHVSSRGEGRPSVISVQDHEAFLKEKLTEYRKVFDANTSTGIDLNTVYKIAILEELLKSGSVETNVLLEKLSKKNGTVNIPMFNYSCEAVEKYNKYGK